MVEVKYYRRDANGNEMAVPPPHWCNGYPDWWLNLPENKDIYIKEPKTELIVSIR